MSGLHYLHGMKMKGFLGIFYLILLVALPTFSFAVSFDCWRTGMSINEVVRVAQEHDIPLAREGLIHTRKGFDSKLIDDKFYKASTVYYRTKLSGRAVTIYLRFTDDPKFVREIEVRFHSIKDKEIFTKEMLSILSKKYGSYKNLGGLFDKSYKWRPDQYSQILMRVGGAGASIFYTDLRIKKDFEEQRRKEEIESINKDAGKY